MKKKKLPIEPEVAQADEQGGRGFYETGNTRPPKDHKRLVAILLAAYIVLAGLMTMMNIDVAFRRNVRHAMTFRNEAEEATADPEITAPTGAAAAVSPMNLSETPAALPNIPQEGGLSLQEIYRKVAPSVVSVHAHTDMGAVSGSGILMSEDGYLITNCHVVEKAQDISVSLWDGETYAASIVGLDSLSDLAVLRIGETGLTPAEFGNSDSAQVGDSVVAIGSPLGESLPGTMTDGIISAINRNVRVGGKTMTLIQTNAALNSGNSGGALVNCYGQVIGITTAKIGDQYSAAGVEGLGFAIPMSGAREIVNQILAYGYVPGRAGLGLELEEMPALYSLYYKLPEGMYISEVAAGSQAEALGIYPGDILLEINGAAMTTQEQVQSALEGLSIGETVTLLLYRQGQRYEVTLPLEEVRG